MSADLHDRAKNIFYQAVTRPAGPEREAYVAEACGNDAALRREVDSLVTAFGRSESGPPPGAPPPSDLKICPACNTTYDPQMAFCPRDRSPLVLVDPLVGTLLDGVYEIERRLGAGGMGEVYLARQTLTDKRVAVKVLPRQMGTSPDRVQRFLTEGRAACRLDHPNVATVYDMRSSSNGLLYMVLEYVDGESLGAASRRRGRFPLAETVETLSPVAEALDLAHTNGVVHRDIKPDNIMLGRDWKGRTVVKLLDLGIAKLLDEDSGLTQGGVIGTPPFMAPEQWGIPMADGRTAIDGRADVYALGVTAYQMLTGAFPFSGPALQDFQRQHTGVPPTAARDVEPSVSEAASQAIARALAKDRSARQPTAGAFVAELRDALVSGEGPATAPQRPVVHTAPNIVPAPGATEPTVTAAAELPRASTGRIAAVAATAALLVAAVCVGVYVVAFRGTEPASPAAPAPASPVAAATREAFSFGIEREERDAGTGSYRWGAPAGIDEPMAPGTHYRLVFTAPENGYVYVVSSGERMKLKAFLTGDPNPKTGVASNRVAAGTRFEFPGSDQALELSSDELQTPFKLVFSTTRLETPAFFASPAMDLDVAAQQLLNDFLSASTARGVRETGGTLPVRVAVPASHDGAKPVAFEFQLTARPQ